jgi:hypothetical protein
MSPPNLPVLVAAVEAAEAHLRSAVAAHNDAELPRLAAIVVRTRRAAAGAGMTECWLSRETVDGLRSSARAGVPFGGEPLTRDLAAVLKEGA